MHASQSRQLGQYQAPKPCRHYYWQRNTTHSRIPTLAQSSTQPSTLTAIHTAEPHPALRPHASWTTSHALGQISIARAARAAICRAANQLHKPAAATGDVCRLARQFRPLAIMQEGFNTFQNYSSLLQSSAVFVTPGSSTPTQNPPQPHVHVWRVRWMRLCSRQCAVLDSGMLSPRRLCSTFLDSRGRRN